MNKKEILALISNMRAELTALEELVQQDSVKEETVEAAPQVVNEVPAPKETPVEEDPYKDEVILGCKILTDLPSFYSGKCSVLKLHKFYKDYGHPKVYLRRDRVVLTALNDDMKPIGTCEVAWNRLSKYHTELIAKGICNYNPTTWVPKTLWLDLD